MSTAADSSSSAGGGTNAKTAPSTSSSTSTSPLPPSSTPPSPLVIGKSFIKQYYQVLVSTPKLIHRFYKPNSVLSHSFEPSVPAEPKHLGSVPSSSVAADGFFQWAGSDGGSTGLSFDFGRGAIDAQETIQGGILLVVTGHMTLPSMGTTEKAKPFVHTFFLNNGAPVGKKRQFYVHNDILRFLATDDEKEEPELGQLQEVSEEDGAVDVHASAASDAAPFLSAAPIQETTVDEQTETTTSIGKAQDPPVTINEKTLLPEKPDTEESTDLLGDAATTSNPTVTPQDAPVQTESTFSTPSDDSATKPTETTKKTPSEPSTTETPPESNQDKKSKRNKSRGSRGSRRDRTTSRSSSPSDKTDADKTHPNKKDEGKSASSTAPTKPKLPGSWASLVAGGAAPPSSTPSSASPSKPSPAAAAAAAAAAQGVDSGAVEESKEGMDTDGIDAMASSSSELTPKTENKAAPLPPPRSNASTAQRTPEATLFLKNIPDRTKEVEIRTMFEPYATTLNKKILGITLKANQGFCFVDFDAREVVDAILKDVEALKENGSAKNGNASLDEKKFMVHGRLLDVGRKVPPADKGPHLGRGGASQQHGSGGSGGRYRHRSSSPGNGTFHKQHRGGGGSHRRSSPRGRNQGMSGSGGGSGQGQQKSSNAAGGSSGGK